MRWNPPPTPTPTPHLPLQKTVNLLVSCWATFIANLFLHSASVSSVYITRGESQRSARNPVAREWDRIVYMHEYFISIVCACVSSCSNVARAADWSASWFRYSTAEGFSSYGKRTGSSDYRPYTWRLDGQAITWGSGGGGKEGAEVGGYNLFSMYFSIRILSIFTSF